MLLLQTSSGSLDEFSDSDSLPSSCSGEDGEEIELTRTIFQEQVKFFCQMKDFLLSQQTALKQQLETLNLSMSRKRRTTHHHHHRPRRHHHRIFPLPTGSVHIPGVNVPSPLSTVKTDEASELEPEESGDNVPHFFSCSSTDRSSGRSTSVYWLREYELYSNYLIVYLQNFSKMSDLWNGTRHTRKSGSFRRSCRRALVLMSCFRA